MESDKYIYKIFKTAPELFFELLGITPKSTYRMTSESVKATNRTMDALLEPTDHSEIHYVVEFQFQPSDDILARIFVEAAILSSYNPDRVYNGIVIFLNQKIERFAAPWSGICQTEGSGFHIFYLNELLKKLEERSPGHPLIALFAPLLEKDEGTLVKNAAPYNNQIKDSGLDSKQRESLEVVLIDWFMLRFAKKTRKEIFAMFALEESLENSVAYQEIIGIGRLEGEEIGEIRGKEIGEIRGKEIGVVAGRLENLKELYAEDVITKEIFQEREKKYQLQLTELLEKYDEPLLN
jgi:predicted transposase YdaD